MALGRRDQLGEGPVWLPDERQLLRVDITAGAVHRWDWATGIEHTVLMAPPVSFAVPRMADGLVVGQGRAIVVVDGDDGASGRHRVLAEVEPDRPGNRFNDAKCDARGRLWAGTMSTTREPGVAGLYRVEPDGACARMLTGTTISNGLGWSADGERMLFIDSTTQRIDAFDFDIESGTLSGRRPFATIPPDDGLPDGLAIDADDGVWVALFGGGALRHYDRDGTLDAVVELPVTNPTCPVFAGPDRDILFVTSARHRLSDAQLAREPLAGAVLAVRVGVPGGAMHWFGG